MHMEKVTSRNIESIGYDAATKKLRVQFKGGALYEYDDVPSETHANALAAESKGRFFQSNIRGQFPGFRKITP